jgi:hypothetical protein
MNTPRFRPLTGLLSAALLMATVCLALPGALRAEDEGEAAEKMAAEEEAPAGPDMITNPYYDRWASFAPGSYVELLMETELPGGGAMENRSRITLKSVSDAEVVLETTTMSIVNGQEIAGQPQSQRHAATVVRSPASDPALQNVTEEGTETLAIGEASYEATWKTIRHEGESGVVTTTTWEVAAVPGGVAKARTVSQGIANVTSTLTVTAFETK